MSQQTHDVCVATSVSPIDPTEDMLDAYRQADGAPDEEQPFQSVCITEGCWEEQDNATAPYCLACHKATAIERACERAEAWGDQ